jgi:ATP-binding cassette subfamily C protein
VRNIPPQPRAAVADPGLVRPDWTIEETRDPARPWLDKNENADPAMIDLVGRVIGEIPAHVHHAFRGIDVAISKGQSVGFVGPSGAGKSTLVDIVLGLLRPQSGRLLIDGDDAFTNLPSWQGRIGFVPQQVGLIDDTMQRNVAFGLEDEDIDEERMNEVVRLVRLDDVISQLPHGLSTVLGESGVRLSGGQRQRVSIARALYRDPDVLVFDEATSALDTETEREIGAAIESLAGERTILIIAHRLSTVRNCDKLVFMKEGRIAAVGRFDDLVRDNAEFRRLAQAGDIDTGSPEVLASAVDT